MNLDAYLDRIGYGGPVRADFATLDALHRAHIDAIAFETLDVQLQRPIRIDAASIFDKIVRRRRGGWCYEMNGLLGWALGEIGFEVTRMAGGVMRDRMGDGQLGNHLCLRVDLDQPWLADVGFGGSLRSPMLLRPGVRVDAPHTVRLEEIDDGYWRFGETAGGAAPFTFDFRIAPADEALLAARCAWLQESAESPFVQTLVLQRRRGETHATLRGRVLTRIDGAGADSRTLESADDLTATIHDVFGIDEPDAATLWPRICARHEAVFGA